MHIESILGGVYSGNYRRARRHDGLRRGQVGLPGIDANDLVAQSILVHQHIEIVTVDFDVAHIVGKIGHLAPGRIGFAEAGDRLDVKRAIGRDPAVDRPERVVGIRLRRDTRKVTRVDADRGYHPVAEHRRVFLTVCS